MITVAQARERLGKIYARKSAGWAVQPFDAGEPVILGLQPPTDRQAAADMTGVARWLNEWSRVDSGHLHVEWETRRWPNTGTQRIPVRLVAGTPHAVAAFIGRRTHWAARHERARRLALLTAAHTPHDGTGFGQAVARVLPRLDDIAPEDFERIFDVLAWLSGNPASGLYPRQLPVAGIDSKWLERHAGIIRPLHVACGGDPGLGLAAPPKMYRVKFLDRALAPGGLPELSAPLSALAALELSPRAVLIVENLQTLLSLPALDGVVALHGAGYDVRWCADLPWTGGIPVLYWGDLDADGLAILAALRGVRPATRSIMMDRPTLERFISFAVPDPNGAGKAVPSGLTAPESEAFEALRELGGLRLEQERIDWGHALGELCALLPGP